MKKKWKKITHKEVDVMYLTATCKPVRINKRNSNAESLIEK